MPKVTFVEFNGTEHHLDAEAGQSVMQVAINNAVPGIIAECGGNCSCATCHAYIEEPWGTLIGPPSKLEQDMIDCALHVTKASRLSCQVQITPALDGLVVRLPESQL
jgi:ferredoxin, 2Fe-2S